MTASRATAGMSFARGRMRPPALTGGQSGQAGRERDDRHQREHDGADRDAEDRELGSQDAGRRQPDGVGQRKLDEEVAACPGESQERQEAAPEGEHHDVRGRKAAIPEVTVS